MSKRKFWTKEENEILRRLYPTSTWKVMLNSLPGRTKNAIKCHAFNALKITKEKEYKFGKNVNLFDRETGWSDEKSWAIGLIWTDGNLGGYYIRFSSTDLELTEQLKNVLGYERNVVVRKPYGIGKKKQYILSIGSKKMSNDLRRIGLHEKKSLTIDYPKELPDEYFWSFYRGLIDGDGSVYLRKSKKTNRITKCDLSLASASKKMVKSLSKKFAKFGIKYSIGVRKKYIRSRCNDKEDWRLPKNNLFRIRILTPSQRYVYSTMYPRDNVPCLHRKKEKLYQGVNKKITSFIWTDKEIELLKKLYPTHKNREMVKYFPGRTHSAIVNRVRILGLMKLGLKCF